MISYILFCAWPFQNQHTRTYSIQVFKVAFIIGCSLDWILFIKLSLLFLPRALYYKKPNNLLSEWKVQDYILLILRIKEAELAELKCKMIFRFLRITEIPPLNHETVIVCIKAEDIIFCFYLF